MSKTDRKQFVLRMEPEMHAEVEAMAKHYGSHVTGTILRYVRMGLTYDQEAIRRERDTLRGEGTGSD